MLLDLDVELLSRDLAVMAADTHPNSKHAADVVLQAARLQSVGNWVMAKVKDRITSLKHSLLALMEKTDPAANGAKAYLKAADKLIEDTYAMVGEEVEGYMERIAAAVAKKTRGRIAEHHGLNVRKPDQTSVDGALVLGAPLSAHFDKMASDLKFRLGAAVRTGVQSGDTLEELAERCFGKDAPVHASDFALAIKAALGDVARGALQVAVDLMDGAGNSLNKVIEAAIHAYAKEGATALAESMDEEDESNLGWQWVAVGDERTCERCEFYDGQRWTADFEPTDNGPEFPDDPPLHFSCRCSLVPSDLDGPPSEGGFDDYLANFSKKEKEEAFGKEALEQYTKTGKISKLMRQKDNIMSLEEFES
jgi:hypothetical protein